MMVQVLFLDVFSEKDPHLNAVEHYNGSNSFLFINAAKVYQFKAKN